MASLVEIQGLWSDDTLKQKVEAAMTVVCEQVRVEDPGTANHANRVKLAKAVLDNPQTYRDEMLRALVAQNKDASVSTIQAATDSAIINNVAAAWNIFADGA